MHIWDLADLQRTFLTTSFAIKLSENSRPPGPTHLRGSENTDMLIKSIKRSNILSFCVRGEDELTT